MGRMLKSDKALLEIHEELPNIRLSNSEQHYALVTAQGEVLHAEKWVCQASIERALDEYFGEKSTTLSLLATYSKKSVSFIILEKYLNAILRKRGGVTNISIIKNKNKQTKKTSYLLKFKVKKGSIPVHVIKILMCILSLIRFGVEHTLCILSVKNWIDQGYHPLGCFLFFGLTARPDDEHIQFQRYGRDIPDKKNYFNYAWLSPRGHTISISPEYLPKSLLRKNKTDYDGSWVSGFQGERISLDKILKNNVTTYGQLMKFYTRNWEKVE